MLDNGMAKYEKKKVIIKEWYGPEEDSDHNDYLPPHVSLDKELLVKLMEYSQKNPTLKMDELWTLADKMQNLSHHNSFMKPHILKAEELEALLTK